MQKLFYFFLLMLIVSCDPVKNTNMSGDKNSEDGFVNLFDGKTTNGWHSYGKTSVGEAWKVVDGALYFDAAPNEDSLRPVNEFLVADMKHLIRTFRWK